MARISQFTQYSGWLEPNSEILDSLSSGPAVGVGFVTHDLQSPQNNSRSSVCQAFDLGPQFLGITAPEYSFERFQRCAQTACPRDGVMAIAAVITNAAKRAKSIMRSLPALTIPMPVSSTMRPRQC